VANPILLPRSSNLTRLLIAEAHRNQKHLGVAPTLAAVRRQGLWIPKGRASVRAVISNCVTCKKINSYAFKYPKPGQYVRDKVNFVRVFDSTGIDYTGNVWVKIGDTVKKMYVLVYTCLSVRAIYLDLLPDMSCKNFLLSFVRFCNLFTLPSKVYSDNASTFLQGVGILAESSVDNVFSDYLTKNNVRHVKIPLFSAWWGSAWERQIRTIKNSLHKVVGRKHFEYFELITLLSEVQNCINDRPLTYLSNDDFSTCVSPNSFLKTEPGRALVLEGVSGSQVMIPNRKELVRSLEMRQSLMDDFKDRWYDEYLLSLREHCRDTYQESWENVIGVGNVVLIETPNKPRHNWQMGLVTELLPGPDGVVRCVRVRRPDRSEGVHCITMLYPLEISVCPAVLDEDGEDDTSVTPKI